MGMPGRSLLTPGWHPNLLWKILAKRFLASCSATEDETKKGRFGECRARRAGRLGFWARTYLELPTGCRTNLGFQPWAVPVRKTAGSSKHEAATRRTVLPGLCAVKEARLGSIWNSGSASAPQLTCRDETLVAVPPADFAVATVQSAKAAKPPALRKPSERARGATGSGRTPSWIAVDLNSAG